MNLTQTGCADYAGNLQLTVQKSLVDMIFFATVIILVGFLLLLLLLDTTAPARTAAISTDYFYLRQQFREAAQAHGADLSSLPIDARGPKGEELTIDIAWFGSRAASRVLLHISGTHGVEGYLGSAIQTKVILDGITVPDSCAVVFIHGLNPWGMAFRRRVNESNVDLNRNFYINTDQFEVESPPYAALNSFLNPATPPNRIDTFYLEAVLKIISHGMGTLRQAIGGGQYSFERGIYFGGTKMEQSNVLLRNWIEKNLTSVRELFVIEAHSGLGEWARDVLFWPLPSTHEKSVWLAAQLNENLQSDAPTEGIGMRTAGDLQNQVPPLIPATNVFWILQEFGTYGNVRMCKAMRDENRYVQCGGDDLGHWTKRILVERFSPGDEIWQRRVIDRGRELFRKMLSVTERGYSR